MPHRHLEPLTPPTTADEVALAMERIAGALDGSGPALVPVPAERATVVAGRGTQANKGAMVAAEPGFRAGEGDPRAAVLAMAGLDAPLEPGPDGDHIALVVPTSGSTGTTKGALLPSSALRHSASAALDRLGGPGQWLLALPTTSIAGLSVLVRSITANSLPVLVRGDDGFSVAGFIDATERLTGDRRYAALVPTQIWRLVAGPPEGLAALASYDAVLVGGAALDDGLAAAATAGGARIVRTYGMTETCGGCVYDGAPLADVEVLAPADGPVELGGPVVFSGYRLRPDLTAAALRLDGTRRWHVTNDVGTIGPGGLLRIRGRLDDVVITGGVKVPAWTVVRALADHPGVRAVEVLGVPDNEWGQRVVAFVVPADLAEPPSLDSIRTFGRPALPAAGLPRQVVVLDAIPLLPSGKPDRAALVELADSAWSE